VAAMRKVVVRKVITHSDDQVRNKTGNAMSLRYKETIFLILYVVLFVESFRMVLWESPLLDSLLFVQDIFCGLLVHPGVCSKAQSGAVHLSTCIYSCIAMQVNLELIMQFDVIMES
jgi:hypothetical protein